ncbi:MAG: DUF1573 domain-containing protein [Planctomycetes bacterium]|nr:DUF1573 domain-containing protein [Planctomycetota bacterium]
MLNTHLARQWVPGILAGVALTVGALSISAQEKEAQREQSVAVTQHATPAAGPQLLIEEPVHDFGEVWIKPTLDYTFVIKNTGTAVLKILNVKPSCGCTTNGQYDREIPPGGTGRIPLKLRTSNLTKFTKRVTVTTNDPRSASFKLTLTGTVKPYVTATPSRLRLSGVKPNQEIIEIVRLSVVPDNVELQVVESRKPSGFRATLQPGPEPKTYDLTIVGRPPFKEGTSSAKILINTGLPDQPTITIPVIVNVPHRVQIKPTKLFIRNSARAGRPYEVIVTNNGDTPVEVLSATTGNPNIKPLLEELEKGKRYRVTLEIADGYEPPARGDTLTLKLMDGREREVRIPIISRLRQAKARKPQPTLAASEAKPKEL